MVPTENESTDSSRQVWQIEGEHLAGDKFEEWNLKKPEMD